MPTANKTTSTINPCPDCPNGNAGGVGVSLSEKKHKFDLKLF